MKASVVALSEQEEGRQAGSTPKFGSSVRTNNATVTESRERKRERALISLSLDRRPQTLRSGNTSLFGLAKMLHNDAPASIQTCHHKQ
ncbi:hypothetical protein JOB18_016219 [Solea senegalensis]|uniref:Uncharacterized protein n=1 Tax=Solea senegalensis TaxID=28829 RepID=A0AAV6S3L3_SOLSE|nr:hypothetical protein JOB18_016219 [Solea senegalensis]